MPTLTTGDFRKILTWADALLEVRAYVHVADHVLEGAAQAVGSDTATLTHLDLRTGHEVAVLWPPSRQFSTGTTAYPGLAHTHPLRGPAAALTAAPRQVTPVRISDVMTRLAWRGTALRTEAMPDISDQMTVPLRRRGSVLHALTLGRHSGGFNDRQRDLLGLGTAHVRAAARRMAAHAAAVHPLDGEGGVGLQLAPHPEWVPLHVAPGIASALSRPDASDSGRRLQAETEAPTISARERQVLELVAEGMTDAQVASRLGLRTATVSRHLHRIYARHDVANRVAAVGLLAVRGIPGRPPAVAAPSE